MHMFGVPKYGAFTHIQKEQQNNAIVSVCVCVYECAVCQHRHHHRVVISAHNRIRRVRQPYGVLF